MITRASVQAASRILGVDPGDEQRLIDQAYRRLCRQYHPDVSRAPDAERRMREINAAYRLLRDPARRVLMQTPQPPTKHAPGAWQAAHRVWRDAARQSGPRTTPAEPSSKSSRLLVTPDPIDLGFLRRGETTSRCLTIRSLDGGRVQARVMTRGDWLQVDRAEVFGRVAILNVTADPAELHGFWAGDEAESARVDGGLEFVDEHGSLYVPARVILRRDATHSPWWSPFGRRAG